jgi:prepilin signal peptidase PulO-like enzyme (type II secretory pathway)
VGIVVAGGACPDCGARLPWRAMLLPLGSALMFAASYLVFDDFWPGLLGGFFASIFLLLTLTDLDRRLLPNRIVYPSILVAAALSWVWPESSVLEVLAGGAVAVGIGVFLLLFSLLFGENAFGMGDVKMIILIGFVVGIPSVGIAVVLGTFAGGVGAAILLLFRVMGRRDYIPHGPFLALGAIIAMFWGQDIWDWYVG